MPLTYYGMTAFLCPNIPAIYKHYRKSSNNKMIHREHTVFYSIILTLKSKENSTQKTHIESKNYKEK